MGSNPLSRSLRSGSTEPQTVSRRSYWPRSCEAISRPGVHWVPKPSRPEYVTKASWIVQPSTPSSCSTAAPPIRAPAGRRASCCSGRPRIQRENCTKCPRTPVEGRSRDHDLAVSLECDARAKRLLAEVRRLLGVAREDRVEIAGCRLRRDGCQQAGGRTRTRCGGERPNACHRDRALMWRASLQTPRLSCVRVRAGEIPSLGSRRRRGRPATRASRRAPPIGCGCARRACDRCARGETRSSWGRETAWPRPRGCWPRWRR
jgi:hypothetical protein